MNQWSKILVRNDLDDLRPHILKASQHADKLHSEQRIVMHCDWRIAIENTLEAAHVPFVHPESIARLELSSIKMAKFGKHSAHWFRITNQRIVKSLSDMAEHFEYCRPDVYVHFYIYPYTTISSVGGFTYSIQEYSPTESGTVLLTRLYPAHQRAGSPDFGFFFDGAAKFNRQVFEEDAACCGNVKHVRCTGENMRPPLKRLEWFHQARREDYRD